MAGAAQMRAQSRGALTAVGLRGARVSEVTIPNVPTAAAGDVAALTFDAGTGVLRVAVNGGPPDHLLDGVGSEGFILIPSDTMDLRILGSESHCAQIATNNLLHTVGVHAKWLLRARARCALRGGGRHAAVGVCACLQAAARILIALRRPSWGSILSPGQGWHRRANAQKRLKHENRDEFRFGQCQQQGFQMIRVTVHTEQRSDVIPLLVLTDFLHFAPCKPPPRHRSSTRCLQLCAVVVSRARPAAGAICAA